ncbi:uncharacterized protein YkwD [Litoreibacter ponti]|uniref:Uncharacterized protein YkwD n=1 Tax=Litoreibacter ponti TaxID=1510457 RepID=A0A2T6BDI0_9RHOB|nr:CAP domain-containing protein [Litoreibacter ponti]PTX54125.1 uncharacterized protein YkwD [Litoreibacter ponti]
MRMFLGTVLLTVLLGCTPEEPVVTVPVATQGELGALLNAERTARGLPPLARDARLVAAAQAHATDMARTGRFSHTGSGGSQVSDRVQAQGFGYCYVAENIAQGQPSAAAAMASWMASPGHRRNNLSREARAFGAARGPGNHWVLVFGRDGC